MLRCNSWVFAFLGGFVVWDQTPFGPHHYNPEASLKVAIFTPPYKLSLIHSTNSVESSFNISFIPPPLGWLLQSSGPWNTNLRDRVNKTKLCTVFTSSSASSHAHTPSFLGCSRPWMQLSKLCEDFTKIWICKNVLQIPHAVLHLVANVVALVAQRPAHVVAHLGGLLIDEDVCGNHESYLELSLLLGILVAGTSQILHSY